MAWVVTFLVVGIVLAIAGGLVFREAARLSEEPPDAVFDPDDALGWVVAHLDDLTASTLTERDAKRIIEAQMEYLRGRGVADNGRRTESVVPVVFSTDDAVRVIGARCAETGEAYLPEQIEAVIDCQMEYLRFIGALGHPADDDG